MSLGQLVKNLTRRNESEEEERKTLYDYVITLMHAFVLRDETFAWLGVRLL